MQTLTAVATRFAIVGGLAWLSPGFIPLGFAFGRLSAFLAARRGISERDCELIRGAFVYEGFGYDLTDPNIATDDAEGSA